MIDNLLLRVNPGTAMATPLTLAPARLPLSSKERNEHRDVLSYLERAAQLGAQRFDISALEDGVSEDEDTDEDMDKASGGSASPARGNWSPMSDRAGPVQTAVDPPSLEVMAPMGIMATAALQNHRTTASALPDDSSTDSAHLHASSVKGVAGEGYFLPGVYYRVPFPLTLLMIRKLNATQWRCLDGGTPGPQADLRLRRLIVERQAAPDILVSGLVTPEDVAALFEMCVLTLNVSLSLLS